MVAIIPNQFQIRGRIIAMRQDPYSEDNYQVDLELDFVKVIKGPREFLDEGTKNISVSVAKKEAASIQTGKTMECMVKRTRRNFLALEDSVHFS